MERLALAACASVAAAAGAARLGLSPPAEAAAAAAAAPQGESGSPVDAERLVRAAHEVARSAHFAVLCTVTAHGWPRARPVQPAAPERGLPAVWLGTHRATRKLAELEATGGKAALVYLDARRLEYVLLEGVMAEDRSSEERRRRFTPLWLPFYSGPEDPAFALLRFEPRRLEVVSPRHGVVPYGGWVPHALERQAGGPWAAEPPPPPERLAVPQR